MLWRRLAAGSWTALILALCWTPRSWVERGASAAGGFAFGEFHVDKFIHVALFLGFATLWRAAGVRTMRVAVVGAAVAVLSEFGQMVPMLGRTTHLVDLICDLAGLAVGLALGEWLWKGPAKPAAEEPSRCESAP